MAEGEITNNVKVVLTEGIWLMLDEWNAKKSIDVCFFLNLDDEIRRDRLVKRRINLGQSEEEAR